eukprot:6172130-Pleurochrysis_carterae.AAC.1
MRSVLRRHTRSKRVLASSCSRNSGLTPESDQGHTKAGWHRRVEGNSPPLTGKSPSTRSSGLHFREDEVLAQPPKASSAASASLHPQCRRQTTQTTQRCY